MWNLCISLACRPEYQAAPKIGDSIFPSGVCREKLKEIRKWNITQLSRVLLGQLKGSQLVKIFRVFWNQRVYYCVYKCPPIVPILSQINPVHAPFYFLNIHLNIILQSTPVPSMWSLPLRFPHQISVYIYHYSHTCYMPYPSHYS